MRFVALLLALVAGNGCAEQATLAVAANFAGVVKQLAPAFERESGHRLQISVGSTGKFYAQIANGAPFDALLSADEDTPRRLEQENLAVPGTRFTYAVGKLALWSPRAGFIDDRGEVLRRAPFKRLAIANPRLAPYGAAARRTMERLGVWATLQHKVVQGENIAQTFQFVSSGNAELGFVALSQLREQPRGGSHWVVPSSLHDPLRQDAVLLRPGAENAAARAFLAFLRENASRDAIRAFGYEVP